MPLRPNKVVYFRDSEFSDPEHGHEHVQRVTDEVWRSALLNNQDSLIVGGHVRRLVGKNIGWGVVEVRVQGG